MTDYPVKIPPELFTEWLSDALLQHDAKSGTIAATIADKAAQWGADQEMEACCGVICRAGWVNLAADLRARRRPKPLTQAEKALAQYDRFVDMVKDSGWVPAGCVRDALERLAELEAKQ